MRALVLGAGSIGRRHAVNLSAMGVETMVQDPDTARAAEVAAASGGTVVTGERLPECDLVVIATPSILHADGLTRAADIAPAVFVEKPLAASRADLARIIATIPGGVTVMVGCNMRFTRGYGELRAALPSIGAIAGMVIDFGWWLPAWRPGSDYRTNYSARRDQGGGIVLDAIHEIDYALALAGPATDVVARVRTSGILDVNVEDIADISLRHRSGAQSIIHVDYLRRAYSRSCTVIGDRGELVWDFGRGHLIHRTEPDAPPRVVAVADRDDPNSAYVAEMTHLLDAVRLGRQPINGLDEAARTTDVALRTLESCGA